MSSGIYRYMVCSEYTDVSREHTASIFRTNVSRERSSMKANDKRSSALLAVCVTCFSISNFLGSFFQQTTQPYIREDALHCRRCENMTY
jgi:hypothetical protein